MAVHFISAINRKWDPRIRCHQQHDNNTVQRRKLTQILVSRRKLLAVTNRVICKSCYLSACPRQPDSRQTPGQTDRQTVQRRRGKRRQRNAIKTIESESKKKFQLRCGKSIKPVSCCLRFSCYLTGGMMNRSTNGITELTQDTVAQLLFVW